MSAAPLQNLVGTLLPPSQSPRTRQPKSNPRREAFIRHYLETGNATESAILAGYSEKSAAAAGSRLLTNAAIKAAIDAALLRQAELSGISAAYVLEGIRAVADNPNARFADRLRAYELLGKHLKGICCFGFFRSLFSRAVQALYVCHPERGRRGDRVEGPVFWTFSAAGCPVPPSVGGSLP